MAFKKTLAGPKGIKLVLDHGDSDTPAMVYSRNGKTSASWDCATGTGEMNGCGGEYTELSQDQIDWLNEQENEVEQAYSVARKNHPEYS